jgi:hypothetical protein
MANEYLMNAEQKQVFRLQQRCGQRIEPRGTEGKTERRNKLTGCGLLACMSFDMEE